MVHCLFVNCLSVNCLLVNHLSVNCLLVNCLFVNCLFVNLLSVNFIFSKLSVGKWLSRKRVCAHFPRSHYALPEEKNFETKRLMVTLFIHHGWNSPISQCKTNHNYVIPLDFLTSKIIDGIHLISLCKKYNCYSFGFFD